MTAYQCQIFVQQSEASYGLYIWVFTNQTWMVESPNWCPSRGTWVASDLEGQGGCILVGGGPKNTQILRLRDFKPFGYEKYKKGQVGDGLGDWIDPVMPVDSGTTFNWTIWKVADE